MFSIHTFLADEKLLRRNFILFCVGRFVLAERSAMPSALFYLATIVSISQNRHKKHGCIDRGWELAYTAGEEDYSHAPDRFSFFVAAGW